MSADRAAAALPPLPAEDHVCPACALAYAQITVGAAVAEIAALPAAVGAALTDVPPDVLRRRREPGVWSAVEYLCHLRDVHMTSTIRLHRARTEERPVVEPMLNDLRARRFGYRDADAGAVLAELRAAAAGFRAEVARVPPDGWARTVTRLPGEERTALWLVRQALHEGRHHLRDLRDAVG
jgi:hypothetical protein